MIKLASKEIAYIVAEELLTVGSIKIQPTKPFTWASGWKSPIYCDNRLSLSFPATRTIIKHYLTNEVTEHFKGVEAIAGVATAGIPQGALIADALNLPFLYVRSKPKGHGMENMIEGQVENGQKVVMVEDLVSTGGSSIKAAKAVRDAGAEVLGMAAIFTYGFQIAEDNFNEAGIELRCLSDYQYLLERAISLGIIEEKDLGALQDWRRDPAKWSN
ncbi:MAG: orotate phosphoribosyltransferase [Marivirga sp.]|jgi:orotate phosphoribosyltransferase